jgi:anti-anti-sigma factor
MEEPNGEIRVERPAEGTAIAVFVGEHDLSRRDDVQALLDELVEDNELVVADFSEATFIDSTMIHLLLVADSAARCRGRTLCLQMGTADIVRRAFELSGVLKRLECASSREEALRRERDRTARRR